MLTRLIDSVILIDHLNGIDKATHFLSGLSTNETAISVITRAEVLVGVDKGDEVSVFMLGKGVLFEQAGNEQFNVMGQMDKFEGDFYV
jgi:predicted nucleic acid-binding protein